MACREVSRRVGVVAHEVEVGELFDAGKHQLRDAKVEPKDGAKIIGIAAQGLSFQGRLIRKTVVVIDGENIEGTPKPKQKTKKKS